jgi:hypothetical protein
MSSSAKADDPVITDVSDQSWSCGVLDAPLPGMTPLLAPLDPSEDPRQYRY